MTDAFRRSYQAQWADMDFNQHMANATYLNYAATTRMLFLDSVGFGAATFSERRIGPVILEDRLTYRREIRMLERFTVDYEWGASTPDGRKFRVRNTFRTEAEEVSATVDSVGLWFDLAARRPIVPPDDLRLAFAALPRTEDYEDWD